MCNLQGTMCKERTKRAAGTKIKMSIYVDIEPEGETQRCCGQIGRSARRSGNCLSRFS